MCACIIYNVCMCVRRPLQMYTLPHARFVCSPRPRHFCMSLCLSVCMYVSPSFRCVSRALPGRLQLLVAVVRFRTYYRRYGGHNSQSRPIYFIVKIRFSWVGKHHVVSTTYLHTPSLLNKHHHGWNYITTLPLHCVFHHAGSGKGYAAPICRSYLWAQWCPSTSVRVASSCHRIPPYHVRTIYHSRWFNECEVETEPFLPNLCASDSGGPGHWRGPLPRHATGAQSPVTAVTRSGGRVTGTRGVEGGSGVERRRQRPFSRHG